MKGSKSPEKISKERLVGKRKANKDISELKAQIAKKEFLEAESELTI